MRSLGPGAMTLLTPAAKQMSKTRWPNKKQAGCLVWETMLAALSQPDPNDANRHLKTSSQNQCIGKQVG